MANPLDDPGGQLLASGRQAGVGGLDESHGSPKLLKPPRALRALGQMPLKRPPPRGIEAPVEGFREQVPCV
jgi:hypothetical protein